MRTVSLLIVAALVTVTAAHAPPAGAQGLDTPITVTVNGATHLEVGQPISRVASGSSEIADVAAFPPDQLLITGKRLGNTTITLWLRDKVVTVPVTVGYPTRAIEEALAKALPGVEELSITTAGTSLVVSGVVRDASHIERAERIIAGFVGAGVVGQAAAAPVVNLLTVAGEHQVQLEVAFAEVSRSALKQMGVNVLAFGAKGDAFVGGLLNPSSSLTPGDITGAAAGMTAPVLLGPLGSTFGAVFGTAPGSDYPFSVALSVLAQHGYARVLAEPTLVALSGESASFLAGGEFPVPLPQALGQVVIQYKKFGIQLEFVPTVVGDTIQLRLELTVSDSDFSLGIKLASVTVPGLTARHATTTIRLRDGQSFAIAGLLSDKVRSSVDKVPLLGDIPILGALFRSTSYRREETELLVVVTVRRVSPVDAAPALPGEQTRSYPSDLELFLLGSHESRSGGRLPRGPVGFRKGGK